MQSSSCGSQTFVAMKSVRIGQSPLRLGVTLDRLHSNTAVKQEKERGKMLLARRAIVEGVIVEG